LARSGASLEPIFCASGIMTSSLMNEATMREALSEAEAARTTASMRPDVSLSSHSCR
jgi:hypothetical protein